MRIKIIKVENCPMCMFITPIAHYKIFICPSEFVIRVFDLRELFKRI